MKKSGQRKRKKLKVHYIGVQNFVKLPETWSTQQNWWCIFESCVSDL